MINNKFEVYKLRRELKRSGRSYKFVRATLNEFGEPSKEEEIVGTLRGLYHESNLTRQYIEMTMKDVAQVRTEKVPLVLCLYEDVVSLSLAIGDKTEVNGRVLKVVGVTNIQDWNLIADVSLEVVDDGIHIEL